ncbi:MAG TPA: thioredoxin domain-containing protein [Polyangiaceae bacterium]|nr:thioredoxin domain-containing protein [Polyangiaceae bacterium]
MSVSLRTLRACAVPLALLSSAASCRGGAEDASDVPADVRLPGVDTHDFTPREEHEFSRYVRELAAPCPSVAAPIAQCVLEKRDCPRCLSAALAIAKAVREGMATDQIQSLYKQRFDAKAARTIPVQGSPSRGPDEAPVTLVEFADFECPFCQRIAPTLDTIWESRRANVRFIYKFMPLPVHPHGDMAARAAIAAQAQGKFWEMHHELFANPGHLEESDLKGYARLIGLDVERFSADLQSPATSARLEADHQLAEDLGVKGTPTIFINGREYDSKLDLTQWLDDEIAAAGGPRPN